MRSSTGAPKRPRTEKSESSGTNADSYMHETMLSENADYLDEELLFDTNALEEEGVQTQVIST